MNLFAGETFDEIYRDLLTRLLDMSDQTTSRLGETVDIGPTTIELPPGPLKLLGNSGRAINPALAIVEACWILSGADNVAPLASITARFRAFSDDGMTLEGAYGERLRHRFGFDQIEAVVDHLRRTPDSRRCFALIAEPADAHGTSRDVPCNIAMMFRIERQSLAMTVINRSNDAIFGLPYDVFSFSLIHFAVAQALGVSMGKHLHFANSMHLYAANRDIAERAFACSAAVALPSGSVADAFLGALVAEAPVIGQNIPEQVGNVPIRRLLQGVGTSSPAAAGDWLEALALQAKRRGNTSLVSIPSESPVGQTI